MLQMGAQLPVLPGEGLWAYEKVTHPCRKCINLYNWAQMVVLPGAGAAQAWHGGPRKTARLSDATRHRSGDCICPSRGEPLRYPGLPAGPESRRKAPIPSGTPFWQCHDVPFRRCHLTYFAVSFWIQPLCLIIYVFCSAAGGVPLAAAGISPDLAPATVEWRIACSTVKAGPCLAPRDAGGQAGAGRGKGADGVAKHRLFGDRYAGRPEDGA